MKILVVDRDELAANMAQTKLEGLGHHVVLEASKDNMAHHLSAGDFDCVLFDPAPMKAFDQAIMNLRRTAPRYPYVLLFAAGSEEAEPLGGANDHLSKPIDSEDLQKKLENAHRFQDLLRSIGDLSEEFPSAGGVIAKSAFNQLFLSSLERAERFNERTFILFISISNHAEVLQMDGRYALDYAASKLSKHLVMIRRQSDIIGQTGVYEYAVILQPPSMHDMAVDAAQRFADAILNTVIQDVTRETSPHIQLSLQLVELPSGFEHFAQDISLTE